MKYKVILADDEPLVLVGLQSMIKWEQHNAQICALAHNGKQLSELIERFCPDVVITDIKMPLRSGLDVLRGCSVKGNSPQFIMLTNLEEFSLARNAIKYQAVDYLVKIELTAETLGETLDKAISNCKKTETTTGTSRIGMQVFYDKFFVRLLNGLIDSREQFRIQSQDLAIKFEAKEYVVCYAELEGLSPSQMDKEQLINLFFSTTLMVRETVSKYCLCYVTSLDMRHLSITFCLSNEQSQKTIQEALETTKEVIKNYFSVQLICSVGKSVEDPLALCDSFFSARQLLPIAQKTGLVAFFDTKAEGEAFNLKEYHDKLNKAFSEMDVESLSCVLEEIAQALAGRKVSRLQALDAVSNILYMSITLLPEGEEIVSKVFADEPDGYRSLYRKNNNMECATWLIALQKGLKEQLQGRKSDYRSKIIKNVQEYIQGNIKRKITLSEVSSIFGFSQNYLSSLFSRFGGCSFIEYINKEKIAVAKDMMANSDLKVYEISDELGFESSFYFSKVFKKVEGVSPREYLQAHYGDKNHHEAD
ncbi:MAG: AraC family transcriptional regulator [Sphaerochaetaceae bacterium]